MGAPTCVLLMLPMITGRLLPQYGDAGAANAGAVGTHSPGPTGGVYAPLAVLYPSVSAQLNTAAATSLPNCAEVLIKSALLFAKNSCFNAFSNESMAALSAPLALGKIALLMLASAALTLAG